MSEHRVLTFPETGHGILVLGSAEQVSAEPQEPRLPRRTSARSEMPGQLPPAGLGTAEPCPGPRRWQLSHGISRPRRPAGAAECDSSIRRW